MASSANKKAQVPAVKKQQSPKQGAPAVVKPFKKRAPLIRRTDAEWLAIFQEQAHSGMNLEDYCKPKGMSPSSFSVKRKTLMEKYHIDDMATVDLSTINADAGTGSGKSASTANKPAASKSKKPAAPVKPATPKSQATAPKTSEPKPEVMAPTTVPSMSLIKSHSPSAKPSRDEDYIRLVLNDVETVLLPREGSAQWIAEYIARKTAAIEALKK